MQIDEFYNLGKWLELNYIQTEINTEFQNLVNVLGNNTKPNQPSQPFDEHKQNLLDRLRQVDFSVLSDLQIDVLKKYELDRYFGPSGAEFLKDCLYRNSLDTATALSEVQKQNSQINQCFTVVTKIGKDLEQVFSFDDVEGRIPLVRVHFKSKASISNIVEYKKWIATWHDIGRGFARLNDSTPNEITVVGTDKGSLIVTLGAISGVVLAMSKALVTILDSVKRIYEIRAEAERIKNLKLKNSQLVAEILNKIEDLREEAKTETVEELIRSFAPDKDGEVRNDLTKAIGKMIDFLDKGGNIDFYLPPVEENEENDTEEDGKSEDSSTDELIGNIEEIRRLEFEIQQIEHTEEMEE